MAGPTYSRDYATESSLANQAWGNAVARSQAEYSNILSNYGFRNTSGQDYGSVAAGLQAGGTMPQTMGTLDVDPTNQYGGIQRLVQQGGMEISGLMNNFSRRGLGRSGSEGEAVGNARFANQGLRKDLMAQMHGSIGDINQNFFNSFQGWRSALAEIGASKAAEDAAWQAANPPPAPAAEGRTDAAPGTALGPTVRTDGRKNPYTSDGARGLVDNLVRGVGNHNVTSAVHLLENAYWDMYNIGDQATMKMITDAIARLTAKPAKPTGPTETASAKAKPKFVPKPDPHPSAPRPDPYRR